VVDDNETPAKAFASRSFRRHAPESAATGSQALEILRRQAKEGKDFAVVLVDLYMPEMNGSHWCRPSGRTSPFQGRISY